MSYYYYYLTSYVVVLGEDRIAQVKAEREKQREREMAEKERQVSDEKSNFLNFFLIFDSFVKLMKRLDKQKQD